MTTTRERLEAMKQAKAERLATLTPLERAALDALKQILYLVEAPYWQTSRKHQIAHEARQVIRQIEEGKEPRPTGAARAPGEAMRDLADSLS